MEREENFELENLADDNLNMEELSQLQTSAPDDTFERLQKRVQIAQVGKDLVEKQAFGFWSVIDAFMRMLFIPNKQTIEEEKNTGDKE